MRGGKSRSAQFGLKKSGLSGSVLFEDGMGWGGEGRGEEGVEGWRDALR